MFFRASRAFIVILVLSAPMSCGEKPVPSEIQMALRQKEDLGGAGASVYAPQEYKRYLGEITSGKEILRQEQSRFSWLRDYTLVVTTFRGILAQGEQLAADISRAREAEKNEINTRQQIIEEQLKLFRELSSTLKDRRLAVKLLMHTEILLSETGRFATDDKGYEALRCLTEADTNIKAVSEVMRPVLARFTDRETIDHWRRLVDKALAKSRHSKGDLLVISKVERRLSHYRKGHLVKHYEAGMGFNYLTAKLYAGDNATPEGAYLVVKKVPASKYFRALLINYPNAEDHKRFKSAEKKGLVPKRAAIGGLIEIHGGGKQGMTNGCVALDNRDMVSLYEQIAVATPVVIIGTTDYDNFISASLNHLQ